MAERNPSPPVGPMASLARWVALAGGAGLSPVWPGTAGAAVGVVFAAALLPLGATATAVALAGLFALGVWASGEAERVAGVRDPQWVVIDETFGAAATLAVLPPDPLVWAAGFVAFRFFDIAKPWPIRLLHDRVRGGLGIMLDDAVAAAMAGAAIWLANWALGY